MVRSVSALAVCSVLVLFPAAAFAQDNARESEVRCFVSGDCQIVAEKKFTLADISTAAPRSQPMARVAASASAPQRGYVAQPPRQVTNVGRPRAIVRTKSLEMQLGFALNSAELDPAARGDADVFARIMVEKPGSGVFSIEGHTDTIGSREQNMDLSRRRAESVVAYLVSKGVPAAQLKAVGYGFDQPRAGLRASDPHNRRVEIVRK